MASIPIQEVRVTNPSQVAGATQEAAGQTAATMKDEAGQVKETAVSAVSDVAGTAKDQASAVAGEAAYQVRDLANQAKTQVSDQAGNATQKLSETVRSLAGELRDMSQGRSTGDSQLSGLVQQLADKGEQLADYLNRQGPGGLVQELRGFAARKPGSFLLGALAAGVATGRVAKGAKSAQSDSGQSGYESGYGQTMPQSSYAGTDMVVEPYPATAPATADPLVDDLRTTGPVAGEARLASGGFAAPDPYDPSLQRDPGLR